jgi:hypothetical protein
MASQLPITYYENEENHGSYVYVSLEDIVNNFKMSHAHDNSVLGNVPRHLILYWAKKGLQEFSYDMLREVKAVELELGDTLDIILPPDYVNYVRVSWVNPQTGDLMPMSNNRNLPQATAYLQDHQANILFDNDGFILEGTTEFQALTNQYAQSRNVLGCSTSCNGCSYYNGCSYRTNYKIDTSKNYNGDFNIDTRKGKIQFSSDHASSIIMLEYISDGLEYSLESDIKINKLAEKALYAWIDYNLMTNKLNVQEYIVQRKKKEYDTAFRNAKIRMMNIKVAELAQKLKERNMWFK